MFFHLLFASSQTPAAVVQDRSKPSPETFISGIKEKAKKKNQSCYNLLSKDNDVTIYSLPKLFDFWKKAFVARPTAWRPKMFTPLGLRFFCNELVTTTCGKSTKLKVHFFGFQRGYRWIATWKKRAKVQQIFAVVIVLLNTNHAFFSLKESLLVFKHN